MEKTTNSIANDLLTVHDSCNDSFWISIEQWYSDGDEIEQQGSRKSLAWGNKIYKPARLPALRLFSFSLFIPQYVYNTINCFQYQAIISLTFSLNILIQQLITKSNYTEAYSPSSHLDNNPSQTWTNNQKQKQNGWNLSPTRPVLWRQVHPVHWRRQVVGKVRSNRTWSCRVILHTLG